MKKKLKELMAAKQAALAEMETLASADTMIAEQQTKFDELKGKCESLNRQIENVKTLIAEKETVEEMTRAEPRRVATGEVSTGLPGGEDGSGTEPLGRRIVVPASARRWGMNLKAFHGADAEVRAYKAGHWFLACMGRQQSRQFCIEHGMPIQYLATGGQNEGANTSGGYLVYDELDRDIIELVLQYGVIRRLARQVPMLSDTKSRPRRTGGLTAYHVGEGAAGTKSNKTWDKVQLIAKKIMVLAKISNELNEDAIISMADDLTREIAMAFAYIEDMDGFLGDGTSTYGGIVGVINSLVAKACTGGVATGAVTAGSGLSRYGTGYAYSNITLALITGMMALLPTFARARARLICSPYVWNGVILPLIGAAGGVTMGEWQNTPGLRSPLGYPVELVEIMPSTAAINQIVMLFGDLSLSTDFGDRRQTTISFSENATVDGESVFERDEVAVRGTERYDINTHDVGSSSTRGAVVGLISHTA